MSDTTDNKTSQNEIVIRDIIENETKAWNEGDVSTYCRDVGANISFTNIRGEFFVGHAAFLKQHDLIFRTIFRNTTLQQEIVSLLFVSPDVAVVDTLATLSGINNWQGTPLDAKGRLRTRLLQVVAKQNGSWKVVAYHNVDIKPGTLVPGSE